MTGSVRHFAQLVGQSTLGDMAMKLGVSRPISVRDIFKRFGVPLQQDLSLVWAEGNFPKHPVNHLPNDNNVPVDIEGGVTLSWKDSGKDSQRAATTWLLHFKVGNGSDQIFRLSFPGFSVPLDFDTVYEWSV